MYKARSTHCRVQSSAARSRRHTRSQCALTRRLGVELLQGLIVVVTCRAGWRLTVNLIEVECIVPLVELRLSHLTETEEVQDQSHYGRDENGDDGD